MPVGTIFPAVDAAQQTMAGYATNVQVTNPDAAPQQLPATGGGETTMMLPLFALGLLGLGGLARFARRRL